MTKAKAWLPAVIGALSLAGIGTVSTVLMHSELTEAAEVNAQSVAVEAGQVALVCPPGVADSTKLTAKGGGAETAELGTAQAVWGLTDLEKLEGGGEVAFLNEGDVGATGISIAAQAKGDLASFMVENCQSTSRELAFASGSMVVGEDTVLVLANPASKPVNVLMQILGSSGPVLESPATVVVPAASAVGVLPGSYTRSVESPVILVSAEGSGVAAWLQTSGLDGEVPLGVARTPGVTPKTTIVLPGIQGGENATLRIGNAGPDPTEAKIQVMSKDGTEPLVGAETIKIPARASSEVTLQGLTTGASALLIEADQEIVAAVTEVAEGEKHPDVKGQNYESRTVVVPAQALTDTTLVNGAQMSEVAEDLGFEGVSVSLVVTNTADEAVELEIQGAEQTLEGMSSRLFPLMPESSRNRFVASEPVYIAYLVTVETPAGTYRSVTPVGVEGVLAQSRMVALEPTG